MILHLVFSLEVISSLIGPLDLSELGPEIDVWANFVVLPSFFFEFIVLIQILF
jgi:hypothetical protein